MKNAKKEKLMYKEISIRVGKNCPISLKIRATRDNWIGLLNYLEDGQVPHLYLEIFHACHDMRIIGPNSIDKRHKTDKPIHDILKRYVAAAFTYV